MQLLVYWYPAVKPRQLWSSFACTGHYVRDGMFAMLLAGLHKVLPHTAVKLPI